MKKFSFRILVTIIAVICTAFLVMAAPVITLSPVSPTVICSTGNDTLLYSVSASGIPANTNVVIYQNTDSTFNPYQGQGDSIGFIPGNAIPVDTVNFGSCVKVVGILIDACGVAGTEPQNEYIILTSGSGVRANNISIDYSSQNNSGATNADINTGANPCGFKIPNVGLIASLRVGSCNASNIIPANPTDSIPPNAIILVFTSDSVTTNYNVNGLCNLGHPVYVLQSSCTRTAGAFTNASNCGATRYRTTTVRDKRQNCSDDFTYDLCNIFNKDGTYAIRQQGLDTSSIANNGIRRNLIDSCGGLDYTQLNFNTDTILKYKIPLSFCNTGFHYIKAITHPNGSQPISNTIKYKLVCNDVSAISNTTNICSGDSVKINISTTDPNAALSWTVSGGAGITGATAGSGNTVKQLLSYSGSTKDSVNYIITSNDAGCIKTQTVKVVVRKCTVSACDSWLYTNTLPSWASCGDLDIVGNKVTVECMFNKTPNNLTPHLVSKHQFASAVNYAIGPIHAEITTTNNGYVLLTAPCPPDSFKTYHVAMVYDGASLKYYRDGFLVASTPCSGNLINNDILTTIGQINSGTGPLLEQHKGYINEVRIWNVARTQQELRSNMNTSLPNPTTQVGLKGYWVFNDLINKQGDPQFNATLGGGALINQTNPQCTFIADSCGKMCTPPQIAITGNNQLCQGSLDTLRISGQFDSIRWSTGATTNQIFVSTPGNYSVTAYSGGCSGTSAVVVTTCSSTICNPSITGNIPFCSGDSITLDAGGGFTQYTWNTGATTQTITVKASGQYTVAVVGNNCTGRDSVDVIVNALPQVGISGTTQICLQSSTVLTANAGNIDSLRGIPVKPQLILQSQHRVTIRLRFITTGVLLLLLHK